MWLCRMFRIVVLFEYINDNFQSHHTLPDCQSTLETTSFLDLGRKESHNSIKKTPSPPSLYIPHTHTHTHFIGWCINLIGCIWFQSPQLAQWKVSRIVFQFLKVGVYNGQIKMLPWWFNHNIAITLMQWDSGGLQTSQCNAIKMQVQPKISLKHRGRMQESNKEWKNDNRFLRIKVTDTSSK